MFGEFLNIIVRSIKLDKSLYKDNKNFGEAAIYFAGLIMILDGIAGAVAANTIIKTAVAMSGLTAILTWVVWSIFIFVVGVAYISSSGVETPLKDGDVLSASASKWVGTGIRTFYILALVAISLMFFSGVTKIIKK